MKVLLIGGGGREHAIGWKLAGSRRFGSLVSAPGNPGLAALGEVRPDLDVLDVGEVGGLATAEGIDLVVVGPEAPLAAGIVDALDAMGVPACGPTRAATRLEASKSYAKAIMERAGVPTAEARVFEDLDAARAHLHAAEPPYVVKADGLAAGKGVLVTGDVARAIAWAESCLGGRFGAAGETVVIEEYLAGPELSVMAVCADGRAHVLPAARDYKRLADGDLGPNTGGMGCYSPVELPDGLLDEVVATVIEPTLAALADEGAPYRGFLYAGLVLTTTGPKVLEFNCRLGDPEAQVVLPLLDGDLLELAWSVANGHLLDRPPAVRPGACVDVVVASGGYPEGAITPAPVSGIERAAGHDGVLVFHAGTTAAADGIVASGGRVLNVVGTGPDLAAARSAAYGAVDEIRFEGMRFRRDIAAP